ncbi:MAG TPA: phage major capsid protein [Propionibacteriaceae bacterium]|nr:phage major capsid protein [Propionibacteriaceae bacterium]
MTVEEILEALRAIVEAAEGRDLTEEEATNYEKLEAQLATARRTQQIRNRQTAYETPVLDKAVYDLTGVVRPSAGPKVDTGYDKAFDAYLRSGKPNADLMQLTNAQQVGTDSEGGYLVSPQFRQKLVEVQKAFGGLANEVDTFSTERGGAIEYPSLDDTESEGAITAEEAAFADGDDLAFGTIALGAWKYTSSGAGTTTPLRVSVELLQDAEFDIQGLISRALGTRIMRKQASDWVNGGGTTLPFGLMHDGLTADVVLDTEATLVYLNLLEAEAALDPAYWQNAKWAMSAGTWVSTIKALEDANERPIILPQAQSGIDSQPQRQLLGYPVVIDQAFNAITQDGVDGGFMALGDFREAYVIRRVAPLTVIVNPWSRMNNGQVEYVAWERADGNIQNRGAYVTIENITT